MEFSQTASLRIVRAIVGIGSFRCNWRSSRILATIARDKVYEYPLRRVNVTSVKLSLFPLSLAFFRSLFFGKLSRTLVARIRDRPVHLSDSAYAHTGTVSSYRSVQIPIEINSRTLGRPFRRATRCGHELSLEHSLISRNRSRLYRRGIEFRRCRRDFPAEIKKKKREGGK